MRPVQTVLKHPLFRGSLILKRQPKYLRFVCKGIATCSRNWDALDQLDDVAEEGEHIIAAEKTDSSSVHLDGYRNGKRFGEWRETATYTPIEEQPPQELLADNERWREWCMERDQSQPVGVEGPGQSGGQ